MGVITTGQTFSSGDQVTASKLNDIANNAIFTSAADTTDNSTLTLGSNKLKVKDAGITATQLATDSVTTAKIQDSAVTTAKLAAATITDIMPIGAVIPFAGIATAVPTGWLLCDGRALEKVGTYAPLFAVIDETYGGATVQFFRIPDLRGRVIAGVDGMGTQGSANRLTAASGVGSNLGQGGGSEQITLLESQMPAHTHSTGFASLSDSSSGSDTIFRHTGATGLNTGSTGGGLPHNNCQPTLVLNYIIKF